MDVARIDRQLTTGDAGVVEQQPTKMAVRGSAFRVDVTGTGAHSAASPPPSPPPHPRAHISLHRTWFLTLQADVAGSGLPVHTVVACVQGGHCLGDMNVFWTCAERSTCISQKNLPNRKVFVAFNSRGIQHFL